MYYCTLRLNWKDEKARRELKDVFELHRTIKKAFPDERGSVLFAVNDRRRDNLPYERIVRVLSEDRPDWSFLSAYENYLVADPCCVKLKTDFHEGQFLNFRLLANPAPDIGTNKPMPGPELQESWLLRQRYRGGFSIALMEWTQRGPFAVLYEGTLMVKDAEKFKQTLREGVGGDVSFGLGMLMVVRAGFHQSDQHST